MELNELTDKAIDYILGEMESNPPRGKWAQDFVMSVADQWERNRFLTDNQKLKLGEIWDQQ